MQRPFEGPSSQHSDEAAVYGQFNPSEFFIPGWKGEGLITASAIVIKNSLSNLTIDAQDLVLKMLKIDF